MSEMCGPCHFCIEVTHEGEYAYYCAWCHDGYWDEDGQCVNEYTEPTDPEYHPFVDCD